jgi:hypothetical protein
MSMAILSLLPRTSASFLSEGHGTERAGIFSISLVAAQCSLRLAKSSSGGDRQQDEEVVTQR